MADLAAIYRAFDADEPLPGDDDRYVDLSAVRGGSRIAYKLVQRITNAGGTESHHLLMGHNKTGKTTELNRTARLLQNEGYATVFFDVTPIASRSFEYTTVLLIMAGQLIEQLSKRRAGKQVRVAGTSAKKLADFLLEREITMGGQTSGSVAGKVDAKVAPGILASLLGQFGIGVELRGGYQRSRAISVKIEADKRGFLEAVQALVQDATNKATKAGYKGLVVICDGMEKLEITATDENNTSNDLQFAMFVDHAEDLRSVPCHVIYTVPISIQANLVDIWEHSPEFVPAVPVNTLAGVDDEKSPAAGRAALKEVVRRRLQREGIEIEDLFVDPSLLDELISVSGGHISDLLLLVREAVLEAQTVEADCLTHNHIVQSIRGRAREYSRLIESKYLPTLLTVDQLKTQPQNSDEYRQLIFRRLVLEYDYGTKSHVDLHPLVAASDAYLRWSKNQNG